MGDFIKRAMQQMDEWEASRLGLQIASLTSKINGFHEAKKKQAERFDRNAALAREHFEREQKLLREHFMAGIDIDNLRDQQDLARKRHRLSVICRGLDEQ